ncbi:kinase-like domain-containing protein [Rhizophagus irregularis DAOM 181602=DAOM 197198]|uniref:Uncharacterized protein n=1 Tax=Rhizophagus irregularis (strain DAOM 181602 / DAOM 197198 / MUCL 43194) TaxID=747089 RepID=A0A2P4PLY5_RHIID|nr:hypothetical protein GLOIN_2v1780651 [Rhizophagus irregularis DAOM 181602=DAOM 197198]PKY32620.1 hypothetical protein RhiirB3_450938 [Rhizophagus irregularis]POG66390.1 hypothetical protein GLOIN_2v1780651 [Rhizophagus irregularis DAOM 181602=DAOM 197198]GET58462.1 kinase-like domain-containing protein [Rhizophagus irregularis DAOM 181602=DAOM 197198]|eukprot:XP_025173256.1 hypothetical protein GLOIN_2v1780651 [Rhizophagus irregularis DAOM 181602=DAOM 197198]
MLQIVRNVATDTQIKNRDIREQNEAIFEWIPYNQLNDIKGINNGLYLAISKDAKSYFGLNDFPIYGISQNPNTKEYFMVFQDYYCEKYDKNIQM